MSNTAAGAPLHPGLWQESDLWQRRDRPAVRAELVNRFRSFAKKIALRYTGPAETTDDLVQVANLGLMEAIDRYDPGRGTPFSAFASPTINGELRRHFRDRVSVLRLPRTVYERVGRLDAATSRLRGELSREPTDAEIAAEMNCSVVEVQEASEGTSYRHPMSLRRGDDDEGGPLEERIGADDGGFEMAEDRIVAGEAIEELDPVDRRILYLRFSREFSQSQIAAEIGCSQMQISRKLRRIVGDLHEATLDKTAA